MNDLLAAVDARFAVTGATTPGWPNPRPDGRPPAEEEYSRCLDPAKFLILRARVEAWRDVLVERGVMVEEPLEGALVGDGVLEVERAARWRPLAPGALSLVVGFRSLDDVPEALVDVGVGDDPRWVAGLPPCECDACDDGSAYYLAQLDELVLDVVTGAFVHVTTVDGASIHTLGNGWSATADVGGYEAGEALLAAGRAGLRTGRVLRSLTGPAWL